jgi:2-polyprenyl-3-methyl-5-hydroxy-6-metoxy-1,4-benzoquinol methylase
MAVHEPSEVVRCLCGATSYDVLLRGAHDRLLRQSYDFTIVRCRSCQLARTLPVPDTTQYERGCFLTTEDGRYVSSGQDLWSEPIARYVRENASGSRLLDVGAHFGNLVAAASALGFEAQGVDPDPVASRAAREKGRKVLTGTIEDVDGSFDVIVMNAVLEHVLDVRSFLARAARLLVPSGRAFIFVPHFRGLVPRLMKANWMGWAPSQHVWHFTPETLVSVVHQASSLRLAGYTTKGAIEPGSSGAKGLAKTCVTFFAQRANWGDQIEAIFEQPADTALVSEPIV